MTRFLLLPLLQPGDRRMSKCKASWAWGYRQIALLTISLSSQVRKWVWPSVPSLTGIRRGILKMVWCISTNTRNAILTFHFEDFYVCTCSELRELNLCNYDLEWQVNLFTYKCIHDYAIFILLILSKSHEMYTRIFKIIYILPLGPTSHQKIWK